MTREEAIKIFNTVLFLGKCNCPKEEIEECLQMAIKALEQESVLDKVKQAREEIENLTPWDEGLVEMSEVLAILDKLIESEGKE